MIASMEADEYGGRVPTWRFGCGHAAGCGVRAPLSTQREASYITSAYKFLGVAISCAESDPLVGRRDPSKCVHRTIRVASRPIWRVHRSGISWAAAQGVGKVVK